LGISAAQTPTLLTDLGVHTEPALPSLPSAGSKVIDPTFGTTILRVTDASSDGSTSSCFAHYSYTFVFNSNNTRLYYYCDPGNVARLADFNATTFTASNRRAFSAGAPSSCRCYEGKWSGVNPDLIYFSGSQVLSVYNTSTNTWTALKDFTSALTGSSTQLNQFHVSANDDIFSFSKVDNGINPTGYIVWKRSTNTILYNTNDTGVDEVHIDPSGAWLNIQMQSGSAKILNIATGAFQTTTWGIDGYYHEDLAPGFVFSAGDDGFCSQGWAYRPLSSIHTGNCLLTGFQVFANLNYSMHATDTTWALNWVQRNDTGNAVRPFENEIFQIKTDGSNQVRRLAHHRSKFDDYNDQPNANISLDGRYVAFTSNWGNAAGRRDLYIVQIVSGSDSTPPRTPTGLRVQ